MMSRRTPRTDGLAERVATSFLRDDLVKVVDSMPWHKDVQAYLRLASLEAVAAEMKWKTANDVRAALTRSVERVRESEHRPFLATYLYGDMPDTDRFCKTCEAVLPRRQPGKQGRPRQYCNKACKQRDYRKRKKMATPSPRKTNRAVWYVDLGLDL